MTDNPNIPQPPEDVADIPDEEEEADIPIVVKSTEGPPPDVTVESRKADTSEDDESDEEDASPNGDTSSEDLQPRLERLGGEPAPDITPEEFARLQQSGQIHIDPRGRVRSTARSSEADAGVSLRKRRAWY